MNWYFNVLKKYAIFSGRARRKEYWLYQLFSLLIVLSLSVVDIFLLNIPGALVSLYFLLILIPSIAVGIRRLHDTGRSGWWFLIALIPMVGSIILIILMVQDSEDGENVFGQNPKAIAA